MPTNSISFQPNTNSANAAYRPIILNFSAVTPCPVAYCDIYIGGHYFKSVSQTQPISTTDTNAVFQFDIQDALQEFLQKYLARNGGPTLVIASDIVNMMVSVFCRFRNTYSDANGFVAETYTAPVQATNETDATPGTGVQSNTFFAINSTLRHKDNQDLRTHLSYFKNGTWSGNVFPMTHKPASCNIGMNDSDYFAILNMSADDIACLKLFYRLKGSNSFANIQNCSSTCYPVGVVGSPTFPDATAGTAYSYSFDLTGTGPFTIDTGTPATMPSWMTAAISGNTITFSGTPTTGDEGTGIDISITIDNDCGSVAFTDTMNVLAPGGCSPVIIPDIDLTSATVGVPWTQIIALSGTAPFAIGTTTKPAWMTAAISGSNLVLSGTPTTAGTGITVQIQVTNCTSDSSTLDTTIDVAASGGGLAVSIYRTGGNLCMSISGGTPPWNYSYSGRYTGMCGSFTIASPTGTTSDPDGGNCTAFTFAPYAGTDYYFKCDVTDSAMNSASSPEVHVAGCLVPETRIRMADGFEKELENIKVGELLWNDNMVTGRSEHEVDRLFVINGGETRGYKASEDHVNILNDGTTLHSFDLRHEQYLKDLEDNPVKIESIQILKGKFRVINISTQNKTYIANGILTHNKVSC